MNDVTEPQDGEMIEIEPTLMSPPDGGQQQEEESCIDTPNYLDLYGGSCDLYSTPGILNVDGLGHNLKRAVIVKEIDEKLRFFETTAKNQFLRIKFLSHDHKLLDNVVKSIIDISKESAVMVSTVSLPKQKKVFNA